jgi:hypothetical protein
MNKGEAKSNGCTDSGSNSNNNSKQHWLQWEITYQHLTINSLKAITQGGSVRQ